MSRGPYYGHPQDPFRGLAVSALTSNVMDTRGAFDITLSWRTTSGNTSINTYQISNASGFNMLIPETTWSDWTNFGDQVIPATQPSGVTTFEPPLGYRFARIQAEQSGASFEINVNILYR